jgi:hypothetical protein
MFLGSLKLPTRWGKYYRVYGGPFIEAPGHSVSIKMAKEINLPCSISIPTRDFSTPLLGDLDIGLEAAVEALIDGKPVYVGCMAGRGRTGLFLAVLAKAFGIPDPVEYVRRTYYAHAVETAEQYDFVTSYQVPPTVLWRIRWAKFLTMFRLKKALSPTLSAD